MHSRRAPLAVFGSDRHSAAMASGSRTIFGRFLADAEAIYSYEGARTMNTLIIGKAIPKLSAFI